MFLSELTDALKEFLVGLDETRVSDNRFEDDSGNLVLVGLQDFLNGFEVIVFSAVSGLGGRLGHTRGVGKAKCGNTGSGLNKERIGVSVVASLELDDLFAIGESTDKTDHTHACLSSGVGETDHFDRGYGINNGLGELVLKRARSSERGSLVHGGLYGIQNIIVGMSKNGRSPSSDVVNVLVLIDIPSVGTLDTIENDRISPNRLEGTDGRRNSTGHQFLSFGKDFLTLGEGVCLGSSGNIQSRSSSGAEGRGKGGGRANQESSCDS
mmetsp:Transcript_21403/g.28119  ORF Transcript_21403/g.28119 Transcript_21403/m.28119 type:complete len:267 (-) Transcript_21403:34-834(-)